MYRRPGNDYRNVFLIGRTINVDIHLYPISKWNRDVILDQQPFSLHRAWFEPRILFSFWRASFDKVRGALLPCGDVCKWILVADHLEQLGKNGIRANFVEINVGNAGSI